ncbi:MAG: enoyl-CoA hydratase/isomerase family protein [Bryobacteraceae bacterium]
MSLRAAREGRLMRVTLARPERRNALSEDLCRRLLDAFREADADSGIGAVLLDAEGPVFCSGMDLDESLAENSVARTAIHEELFLAGAHAAKPIVAAVQGGAVAGGVGLVAQAHVVIADDHAVFSLPEIWLGMWPFVIWASIERALGERRALALSLTGEKFNARSANQWGLVHRVVSRELLPGEALAVAGAIADAAPGAVTRGMKLAREARELVLDSVVAVAAGLRAEQLESAEYRVRVAELRAKRKS